MFDEKKVLKVLTAGGAIYGDIFAEKRPIPIFSLSREG